MAFHHRSSEVGKLPAELESLFAAYRTSVPEVEPSSDFMPGLWERIDSQRRVTYRFRNLASGFVTAAAALCLFLTTSAWNVPQVSTAHTGTYVDLLADDTDDTADSATL